MTTALFKPAQRTQAKLRLAIDGPSGSGKTYSALLIAKGLAGGDLSKVALLDTERGSGSLYSDLGAYAILDFGPPYTVARFVKAHDAAVAEGYEVIVVDSLTHFWSGEGGILDAVDKFAKTNTSGNTFAAWKQGTPLQKQLMDTMLASPCHIIATIRSKVEWVIEDNEKGKKVPRKVGLAPDQRKDLEYEYTIVLNLSREHIATASKDRTSIFDERLEVPSEAMGAELAAWLGSAAPEPPKAKPTAAAIDEQREQAAAAEPASNGTITQAQAKRLHENLLAKGRESAWFLQVLHDKDVGDGVHLTSIPSGEYERLLEIVAGFADPPPPEPTAPAAAPVPSGFVSADDFAAASVAAQEPAQEVAAPAAASAAPESEVAPQAAPAPQGGAEDDDGFDVLDDAIRTQAEKKAEPDKPKRKPTVTDRQKAKLGELCTSLEHWGIGEQEWRTYLETEEGVRSRKLLTMAAATRMIDRFNRWSVDLQTLVVGPKEGAAA